MFTLKFKTGNAAFTDCPEYEVCRILTEISKKVENGYTEGDAWDINGNNIGSWKLT